MSISPSGSLSTFSFKMLPFFKDNVCTVILSGESETAASILRLKSSNDSSGSPAIKSIFTSNPYFFASPYFSMISSAVCFLPIILSVLSLKVCGFTQILVTPWVLRSFKVSSVIQSGLPASTVYSVSGFPIAVSILSNLSSGNDTGVPPPTYTERRFLTCFLVVSISLQRASTYPSNCFSLPISLETNEQYRHLDGQNGIPTKKSALPSFISYIPFCISIMRATISILLSETNISFFIVSRQFSPSEYANFTGLIPVNAPHSSFSPE